jgi:peptidoglycan hydrolase-like protein with peptidoglycan-binding domain
MITRTMGLLALGLLAACGTNPTDRVTGGAAAGAATGAGVGALGGPVGALAGAAIGGGAGAITGAATSPNEVNLGRPLWNDPEVRVPGGNGSTASATRARGNSQTRELQQALARQGYDVGPIDGVYGAQTRQAVMQYQQRNNMAATGQADSQMMSSLGVTAGSATGARAAQGTRDTMPGAGTAGSQTRTGSGATVGGATGGGTGTLSRPNPTGSQSGSVPRPSNNPMNDPIGGSGSAIQPGFNQNRDGGAAGGGGSSGTGGN